MFKKLKSVLALVLAAFGILAPSFSGAQEAAPMLAAFNGATYADNGKTFSANQFAGKKVLVMFWKSDCPPCLVEMSGFENIRKAAGAMPIIVVTPTWGKKEQYFLQKPIKNSALILKYKTGFNNALEYFGDPEGGVPYSVMFNEKGIGCISNLGPVNAKVMKDMFNECGK